LMGLCISPSPLSLLIDSALMIHVRGYFGGFTLNCTIPSGLNKERKGFKNVYILHQSPLKARYN